MNFIWDKITEWLKELLVGGVVSNLSGLFDSINTQVADVAGTVGASPQAWNGSIFGMIRSLSENVMVPIAGIVSWEENGQTVSVNLTDVNALYCYLAEQSVE